jgi:hypothetical protein
MQGAGRTGLSAPGGAAGATARAAASALRALEVRALDGLRGSPMVLKVLLAANAARAPPVPLTAAAG